MSTIALSTIRKGACDPSTSVSSKNDHIQLGIDLGACVASFTSCAHPAAQDTLRFLCDLLGQSRFFARRWRNCFSSRNCVCFLDQVLQRQFSNLVLDGDRGRKLESSAKPKRVHFILLVCLERFSFGFCSRIFRKAFGQPLAMPSGIIDVGCRT